jgi:hypothetical protein
MRPQSPNTFFFGKPTNIEQVSSPTRTRSRLRRNEGEGRLDEDPLSGDAREYFRAPSRSYRRLTRGLGLVGLGAHLYAPKALSESLGVLERVP